MNDTEHLVPRKCCTQKDRLLSTHIPRWHVFTVYSYWVRAWLFCFNLPLSSYSNPDHAVSSDQSVTLGFCRKQVGGKQTKSSFLATRVCLPNSNKPCLSYPFCFCNVQSITKKKLWGLWFNCSLVFFFCFFFSFFCWKCFLQFIFRVISFECSIYIFLHQIRFNVRLNTTSHHGWCYIPTYSSSLTNVNHPKVPVLLFKS